MHQIQTSITYFNELFTFFVVFPAIILLGIYLTYKLKFIQISQLKRSFTCLLSKKEQGQGNISHYEAISAVLAGNLGTGNISGMAVALATGGPGALVWMWLMAFLGAAIQYASCVLGLQYRQKNARAEYVGGPMYYLTHGLGMKSLGILFAIFAILAAFTVGNFVQVNSVILPLEKMALNPLACSLVLAVLVGAVLLGGAQRFAKVASGVVPVMAILYLGAALTILAMHWNGIWPAFKLMLGGAWNDQAFLGGTLGFALIKTVSTGFERGIFATDAGTGIAPIIQAGSKTASPVINGIVALTAPFLVMAVCTITGLVLIVTGAWQTADLASTNMCTYAFEKGLGSKIGCYVVIVSLWLFAYTTILAWACCGERAFEFLFGRKHVRYFRCFYILLIPVGALAHVDYVWLIADIAISFMLTTNLIGVAALSPQVIKESRDFFLKEQQVFLENRSF